MSRNTSNYYTDANGKTHALAPNFVISDYYPDTKPKPKPKPEQKPKPKPVQRPKPVPKPKPEKPTPNYREMFDAFAKSVEIRKQEANTKKSEQERLLMQAYDATRAKRKELFDASVSEQNKASDESLRHAYIASELSRRDLSQQQSAMGISGGASVSGEMMLKSKYQKERQTEEARRSKELGKITEGYNHSEESASAGLESERKKLLGEYDKVVKSLQAELDRQYAAILRLMK